MTTSRRDPSELPLNPARFVLHYRHSHRAGFDDYDDALERWAVTIAPEGASEEAVGELVLLRMRAETQLPPLEVAYGWSSRSESLLRVAQAVYRPGEFGYGEEFASAVAAAGAPPGDLLVLDRAELVPALRGFGIGPVLVAEALRRLEGGCCAVAVEPRGDGRGAAELYESLGFAPFRDGVYLRFVGSSSSDRRTMLEELYGRLQVLSDNYEARHQG